MNAVVSGRSKQKKFKYLCCIEKFNFVLFWCLILLCFFEHFNDKKHGSTWEKSWSTKCVNSKRNVMEVCVWCIFIIINLHCYCFGFAPIYCVVCLYLRHPLKYPNLSARIYENNLVDCHQSAQIPETNFLCLLSCIFVHII